MNDKLISFKNRYLIIVLASVLISIIFSSCSSSDLTKSLSAEDRFEIGKTKFDDEDYLEAINEFEIIKIQFPGSAVADDAQYYLAECRSKKEEYLLAAVEYQELKNNMPASPLVPMAQYKIGLCYYTLSPKSSLDQQYTRRAIDEFQAFIEYYPKDEMVTDASAKIKELNERLAKKLYDSAELYVKLEYYKAATIYYNSIIEKYHDTKYGELAYIGKAKSFISRNKFGDAKKEIDKFMEKYPNSGLIKEAETLQREIDERLRNEPSTVGVKN